MELAFVGCAHIHTPGFIEQINKRGDMRVKYVWDHEPARAARRAAELGAAAVTLETILADPAVAAAVVCSETNRHEDLVLPLAAAKKDLFVEKPLGMGAGDAYRMAAAIEAAGVRFTTGYFMRGDPVNRFLRAQVGAGAFGTITRVRGSNCHSGALGGWFDSEWRWMADPAVAGVGAFGDLGTHALDILMWLVSEVTSATGALGTATRRYGDCDEYGEGVLRFASGAVGTLAGGWVDVANPVTLLISGTEGHAAVVNGQLFFVSRRVEGADGKVPWRDLPPGAPAGFTLFLDVLAGDGDPSELVTAREAAARSAAMAAIYAGAQQGTWVKVES